MVLVFLIYHCNRRHVYFQDTVTVFPVLLELTENEKRFGFSVVGGVDEGFRPRIDEIVEGNINAHDFRIRLACVLFLSSFNIWSGLRLAIRKYRWSLSLQHIAKLARHQGL